MCIIARSDAAASGVAPRLLSIATAVPPNVLEQDDAAAFAARTFGGRMDGYAALSRVFASTGIARRYLAQPFAWYAEPRGFAERSDAYIDTACELFATAARQALSAAGLAPADVDAVLFVSSTGIATPSIEARVLPALGFRDDAARLPIFGLGCAGGVTGLAAAATFARGRPGSVVLLVTLELCSLAFRPDRPTKKDLVSTALFGDGAAAAVLSCRETDGAPVLGASTEHLWPETLDIMGWSTDDVGLGVILSRSLPAFIAKKLSARVRPCGRAYGRRARRRRSRDLPSGRDEGARVDREFDVAAGGKSRSRARHHARLWQYVITDRPLRARTFDRGGLPRHGRADGARTGFHGVVLARRRRVTSPSAIALIAYVVVQRLVELAIAKRNTDRLLAAGAVEWGRAHYPVMVALHASWLVSLAFFGWNAPLHAVWLVPFALLQLGRFWVLRTLGSRWTTRIVLVRDAPPIVSGPFRFVRHPNYLVVAFELPCVSLALGLGWHAALFGVLNLAMLAYRIRVEDAAFASLAA